MKELQELLRYFEHSEPDHELSLMVKMELENTGSLYEDLPQTKHILHMLDDSINSKVLMKPVTKQISFTQRRIYRYWPAAAVLVLLFTGLYYANNSLNLFGTYVSEYKNDIAPGGDRAFLTLANGKRIELNDSVQGELALESGVLISKTADGQVRYQISDSKSNAGSMLYNTLSTPKGGSYQVVLSDGTIVYLNAASSIRFPSSFANSNERRVELQGEGYFEVAHQTDKPFYVQSGTQELKVLGTHFNVNAYTDESSIKTTLMQGSVKIDYPEGTSTVLKPGQQSYLHNGKILVNEVDAETAIDWKRGEINLKDENFQATMRKIARWYNVEVIFDDSAPTDLKLGGLVSREKNISTILKVMELTGRVHFKVEGRRVTVMR